MKILAYTKPDDTTGQTGPPSVTSWEELPLFLTPANVESILDISRNTAYEYLHSKGCPTITVGKQLRVQKDAFRDWLNQQAGKNNTYSRE